MKVSNHFLDYIQDWKHFEYVVVGGYGSSKSYNTAIKLVTKCLQEKRRVLVVREVYETFRESCYNLLIEVCSAMNLIEGIHYVTRLSPMQIRFFNGSEFIFKGMDKSEKLKSIHGISIVWIEECSEVKYEGIKEILGRLRHATLSNHIIYTTNPVSKSNWVFKHFFKRPVENEEKEVIEQVIQDDIELYEKRVIKTDKRYYHHSVVEDNPFVPIDYIERLDELKTYDYDQYRVAKLGQFGTHGLRVLPQLEKQDFDKVMNIIESNKQLLFFNGMDFGFETSYNALVRCAVDHKERILYIYWEYYTKGKTDPEIAEDIKEFKTTQELIKSDSAEPKAIKYYRQMGFNMKKCKKFKGSRTVYTKKVKRFKKIVIASNCRNTWNELHDLVYFVDKNGETIEDRFNIDPHTLSAIWYALDTYEVADLKGGRMFIGGRNINEST